jgi:alpha-beta hydrolase superfamily lysophospholipase
MRKTASSLSFQIWIGFAKEVIGVVDWLRLPGGFGGHAVGTRCSFPSGDRQLAANMVQPNSASRAGVLICHGIGDRMSYWVAAQEYLRTQGIASLIFHYSGHAGSTGAMTPENLVEDAHSAYAFLRAQLPANTRAFVLGFSLGSGLATEVLSSLQPAPAGLILAQPFTSLRLAAAEVARPLRFLSHVVPDIWKTAGNIRRRTQPLLIVHSDGDQLFPVSMARTIHAAAIADSDIPAQIAIPAGYRHNAIYLQVPEDYWASMIRFIEDNAPKSGNLQ